MEARTNNGQTGSRHLKNAPLVRVLCQVRWHMFPAFEPQEVVARIGKALASKYPIGDTQQEYEVIFTPEGPRQGSGEVLHRLSSVDGSWKVTLGKTFVTLETTSYAGHQNFIERLGEVIDALTAAFPIPAWLRIGYRYTNRITGEDDLASLEEYFNNPSVLGGLSWTQNGVELLQSVTESVYKVAETTLLVRSASLAPRATVDPTLEPVDAASWILDLDAFHEGAMNEALTRAEVEQRAGTLANVAYQHFDGLISERFVERFG